MKDYLKHTIYLTILLIVFSCSKDDSESHQAKVYAVGHENKAILIGTAKYWEDSVETVLAEFYR